MTELKPCPFCGSLNIQTIMQDGMHWGKCLECEATGPLCSKYDGEEDGESINWNTRSEACAREAEDGKG